MNLDTRYEATDWLGLPWSERYPFRTLRQMPGIDTLTTDPGLYRVRHETFDRLAYVGETGRSTRGHVGSLARGTHAEEMPFRDPHTAAPTLWAIREGTSGVRTVVDDAGAGDGQATTQGGRGGTDRAAPADGREEPSRELRAHHPRVPPVEIQSLVKTRCRSFSTPFIGITKAGQEALTGWFWSPDVATTGHLLERLNKANYSKHGEEHRGGPLPRRAGTERNDWSRVVRLDRRLERSLARVDGLRLVGTGGPRRAVSSAPDSSGVYRLFRPEGDRLTYLGETLNLRSRIGTHRGDCDVETHVEYATLPERITKHELLEVETDLSGAHWLATSHAPAEQF